MSLSKNRKGQIGYVGVIATLIMFFIIWALFFADFINTWADQAVGTGNFGGLESFLIGNLNLFILISLILGVLSLIYFGGGR